MGIDFSGDRWHSAALNREYLWKDDTLKQKLLKILQTQGFGTRKSCIRLLRKGFVVIDGKPHTNGTVSIETDGLHYSVCDEPYEYSEKVYGVLYKPAGYECSHDPQHNASVFTLFPLHLNNRGIQLAGRLDTDTTGLLLFSDDGTFIHKVTSPKRHLPKSYRVTTKHPISDESVENLISGVVLRDSPDPVSAIAATKTGDNEIELTVTGGKYHQIKRMIAAVGNRPEQLHRISVGNVVLEELKLEKGQFKLLTDQEAAGIFQTGESS
jgi:16S rRNA pseudouridine516 synthase